jgi:hypothetical protein
MCSAQSLFIRVVHQQNNTQLHDGDSAGRIAALVSRDCLFSMLVKMCIPAVTSGKNAFMVSVICVEQQQERTQMRSQVV